MADILTLPARDPKPWPHLAGPARCVPCGHEFTCVAPIGTIWLHCPACGADRALLKYPCIRNDRPHWTCGCGNELFCVTKDGYYCPNCGDWQHGF